MKTPFAQKVISILKGYCDSEHGGNARAASKALGIDPDSGYFSRWLKCFDESAKTSRVPKIDSVGPCLDKLGAVLLSQEELAKKCGVSRQTINAIENNKYDPTLSLAFSLAKELAVTVDELFGQV